MKQLIVFTLLALLAGCLAVQQQAESAGYISYTRHGNLQAQYPLVDLVRITGFGEVKLSLSFLVSCALAVSSTMLVTQALKPLAQSELASPLARIDHLGSYACRNIYHRAEGRLSEQATAEAWDLSSFRLQNGRHCCKVIDELAFRVIERSYLSKTLLTRRILPRGCPK